MTITQHYLNAKHRLILLDYDGTLVDIAATFDEAKPTSQALNLLTHLAADPANTVVIISGRDHVTLETWLGHLPVSFVAEHGLFFKLPHEPWRPTRPLKQTWKSAVRHVMEAAAIPGAHIEDKTLSLVWHYRNSDPAVADPAVSRLMATLRPLASAQNLKILPGRKIIEVLPDGVDKGAAAQHWLKDGHYDFILAAGDDVTDEDIFRVLPSRAYKIKIGVPGPESAAPAAVPDPTTLRNFITTFSDPV
jgi:trehalose 6-phosphate synthase/phosphatase